MKFKVFSICLCILSVFFRSAICSGKDNLRAGASSTFINIHTYGADNSGKKDVSHIFQNALNQLSKTGGGSIFVPTGIYLIKYPVFVGSNIKIYGQGRQSVIEANISISEGRCAFLVGNSYEVNYNAVESFRKNNTRGWPVNANFNDIKLPEGLDIQSNDSRLITRNASIENLLIKFDYTNCKSNWGGYGIQFSNSSNCSAKNIWTINACQAVGIGSDTSPATPACVNVYCYNIHVIKPDPVHTYYSIGFISNSNNCGIIGADSFQGCSKDSPDGSLIATNFAKNCVIKNIKGTVGQSQTAEGVLLNNSYGCTVENIAVNEARIGVSVSFTDYGLLLKYKDLTNSFSNITINNCESGICLLSKFNSFDNIILKNCKAPIIYNINATNNLLLNLNEYLDKLSDSSKKWIIAHNKLQN